MSPSIRHARKHFSQAEGGQLDEVRQVMGMLAFPSDTHISPYKVSCPLKQARTLKRFFSTSSVDLGEIATIFRVINQLRRNP